MLFNRTKIFCVAVFINVFLGATAARATLLDKSDLATQQSIQENWQLSAAKKALANGFPSIAEKILNDLLARNDSPIEQKNDPVYDLLMQSLLAQKDFEAADSILKKVSTVSPRFQLLASISAFHQNDLSRLKTELSQLTPDQLNSFGKPWYFTLSGVVANRENNSSLAEKMFSEAKTYFKNNNQRAILEHLIFEENLLYNTANTESLETLENNLKKFEGQNFSYRIVRQYAIALHQQNRTKEALSLLNDQINQESFNDNSLELLLHTHAIISGIQSPQGKNSLQELIEKGVSAPLMESVLYQLTSNASDIEEQENLLSFITLTLNKRPQHPIKNSLLLARANLSLALGKSPIALNDANKLISTTTPYFRTQGLQIALQEALKRNPPQYRLATDYIIDLLDSNLSSEDLTSLQLLLADCFYLNNEFDKAATAYQSLLSATTNQQNQLAVLLRKLQAEVNAEQFSNAQNTLAQIDQLPNTSAQESSYANWIVYTAIPATKAFPELITKIENEQFSNDFKYRFIWLATQYAIEINAYQRAKNLIENYSEVIEVPQNWTPENLTEFEAHMSLLRLKLFIETKQLENAQDLFQTIISENLSREVIEQAYIELSRYLVRVNNLAEARRLLNSFADKYPDSKYAPIALYESALSAASRSTEETDKNAIQQFTYLIETYPDDPRAFFAHLKIADIFRQSGAFADARSFYENTLNKFSTHPLSYLVLIGLADTLNALGREETVQQAILIYTDLLEQQSLDINVQIEVSAKLGAIYKKQDLLKEAETTYWNSLSKHLLQADTGESLQVQGRWWMSRTILHLGDLFLEQEEVKRATETYKLLDKYQLPGKELGEAKIRNIKLNI